MRGKPYVRSWPVHSWWASRPTWSRYMVREASALFVAGYTVFLLVLLGRAGSGRDFTPFFEALRSPLSLVLHLVALAFLLYHAVTWFWIAAQALPLWRGEAQVKPGLVVALFYVAWLAVSALLLWGALAT